jgi:hypothetical protein
VGGRVAVANRSRSGNAQGRESRWGKEHLDPWHNAENAAHNTSNPVSMTANLDYVQHSLDSFPISG